MNNHCEENLCCGKHIEEKSRLRKIEGQIKGILRMIENDRYCIDILIQLKSVRKAINKVEQNILKRHIQTCLKEAMISESNEEQNKKIDEIMEIISKF